MAVSSPLTALRDQEHGPKQSDLDKCVHCGLCLNACPTYRELGVEMDSPRGRIYQMVQVANGAPITDAFLEHMSLCLACRGCETACPSGVPYGRLIESTTRPASERTAPIAPGSSGRCREYSTVMAAITCSATCRGVRPLISKSDDI